MYFYQRIRDLREDNDKTQTEIAEILNMKYQQYGFIILSLILVLSAMSGAGLSFITEAVDYVFNFIT